MIERDKAIMVTGSVTSGEAIAQQSLCQEMGVIFMAGLTHSNDTTGKDKRRYGFRHFFNAYQSGVALAPVLAEAYGKDRKAYHLTADYTWGWTQEESIKNATEALGWQTVTAVRQLPAGDHELRLLISAGNMNLNYVDITSAAANTAPTVSIATPANGATVSGTMRLPAMMLGIAYIVVCSFISRNCSHISGVPR